MLLQPRLLLLDEPTSQLDPVAASTFLTTLSRLNRELGVTVLLVEQRLEEALPLCDRVLLLDKGRLAAQGSPDAVGKALCRDAHGMFEAMPTAMRVWAAADGQAPCPVTVREGRAWLAARAQRGLVGTVPCPGAQPDGAARAGARPDGGQRRGEKHAALAGGRPVCPLFGQGDGFGKGGAFAAAGAEHVFEKDGGRGPF